MLVRIQFMCGILALQAGAAFGQSMMEVSAAAAGGSAAGAASKNVSEGIDSIFGKVSKQTNAAAAAPNKSGVSVESAVPPGPAASEIAAAPSQAGRTAPAAKPAPEQAPTPIPAGTSAPPAPRPEPPLLTAAQLAGIQHGASRSDVLAQVGTPCARIFIPEDGHLVEIYQYAAKGQLLGSVRLTDGAVSTVRVSGPK